MSAQPTVVNSGKVFPLPKWAYFILAFVLGVVACLVGVFNRTWLFRDHLYLSVAASAVAVGLWLALGTKQHLGRRFLALVLFGLGAWATYLVLVNRTWLNQKKEAIGFWTLVLLGAAILTWLLNRLREQIGRRRKRKKAERALKPVTGGIEADFTRSKRRKSQPVPVGVALDQLGHTGKPARANLESRRQSLGDPHDPDIDTRAPQSRPGDEAQDYKGTLDAPVSAPPAFQWDDDEGSVGMPPPPWSYDKSREAQVIDLPFPEPERPVFMLDSQYADLLLVSVDVFGESGTVKSGILDPEGYVEIDSSRVTVFGRIISGGPALPEQKVTVVRHDAALEPEPESEPVSTAVDPAVAQSPPVEAPDPRESEPDAADLPSELEAPEPDAPPYDPNLEREQGEQEAADRERAESWKNFASAESDLDDAQLLRPAPSLFSRPEAAIPPPRPAFGAEPRAIKTPQETLQEAAAAKALKAEAEAAAVYPDDDEFDIPDFLK